MPKVGKKEFPYTAKGEMMAKMEAKKTGNKMKPVKITGTATGTKDKKAVNFKDVQKVNKTVTKATTSVKKTVPPVSTAKKSNAMIKNGMKMGKRAGGK
jgi:predicted nucleotidyltransferase